MDVYLHAFSTSALNVTKWSASHRRHLTPGKTPDTNRIGSSVDPKTGLDAVKTEIPVPVGVRTPVFHSVV